MANFAQQMMTPQLTTAQLMQMVRDEEAANRAAAQLERQYSVDAYKAVKDGGKFEYDVQKDNIARAQKIQDDIRAVISSDDGWGSVERTFFNDKADSAAKDSRKRVAESELASFVNSPDGLAMAQRLGVTQEALARRLDGTTGGLMAMANVTGSGSNNSMEKTYPVALQEAIQTENAYKSLGIADPVHHLAQYGTNKYLTESNPGGMAMAGALNTANVPVYARDALLNNVTLDKLRSMYGNTESGVWVANKAGSLLPQVAKDAGLPPETLAAVISKNPKLMDIYLSSLVGSNAGTDYTAGIESLRTAASSIKPQKNSYNFGQDAILPR